MIRYENHCVGCPEEIWCLDDECPHVNVPVYYCDMCGDNNAIYNIENKDYCEECAKEYLFNEFDSLTIEEKAEILQLDFECNRGE